MVVRIEIWPGGDEATKRTIGTMQLGNVSELRAVSSYQGHMLNEKGVATRGFLVHGHERAKGPWELVRRALAVVLGGAT